MRLISNNRHQWLCCLSRIQVCIRHLFFDCIWYTHFLCPFPDYAALFFLEGKYSIYTIHIVSFYTITRSLNVILHTGVLGNTSSKKVFCCVLSFCKHLPQVFIGTKPGLPVHILHAPPFVFLIDKRLANIFSEHMWIPWGILWSFKVGSYSLRLASFAVAISVCSGIDIKFDSIFHE